MTGTLEERMALFSIEEAHSPSSETITISKAEYEALVSIRYLYFLDSSSSRDRFTVEGLGETG